MNELQTHLSWLSNQAFPVHIASKYIRTISRIIHPFQHHFSSFEWRRWFICIYAHLQSNCCIFHWVSWAKAIIMGHVKFMSFSCFRKLWNYEVICTLPATCWLHKTISLELLIFTVCNHNKCTNAEYSEILRIFALLFTIKQFGNICWQFMVQKVFIGY